MDKNILDGIEKPVYIVEEQLLRRNLQLIKSVAQRANVDIILAFKAFALWKTFPIFREYIDSTTASSLCEARLAVEEFGAKAHTYSPAYTEYEIEDIAKCSSYLTFNSFSQFYRLHEMALKANPDVEFGIRINPEYSEIETEIYNPCAPGSRFGVLAKNLPNQLPRGITGFHCHSHCESGAEAFARTLVVVEEKFSRWFQQISWINFGGGHLMTRKGYNVDLLVDTLNGLHARYPHLKIVLEPGSAFAWQTGVLVSHVVDIVENAGVKTAIVDVSFTCHMPDCLEMPYMPQITGGHVIQAEPTGAAVETVSSLDTDGSQYIYKIGGNSCLSGDFLGCWKFDHELSIGEILVFEDMIHYTTVKTNMFNGVSHPALAILHADGKLEYMREFGYEDYKNRMD